MCTVDGQPEECRASQSLRRPRSKSLDHLSLGPELWSRETHPRVLPRSGGAVTRLETSSDVKRQASPLRDPELAPRDQSLLAAAKRTLVMIAGGMSLPDVLTN